MQSEIDEYETKLEELKAPEFVKEKLEKEIARFKASAGNSAETGVLRTYIDTLFEMPWSKTSRDNKNIDKAAKILREDHYGLEKVKERILEFLSVRLLTKKGDSPILCLVGPPGTGKTSIARSIARALSKKYVRISLGGVHDEAEIRGHRRTYIGAMPGRIASGLAHAGVKTIRVIHSPHCLKYWIQSRTASSETIIWNCLWIFRMFCLLQQPTVCPLFRVRC